MSPMLQKLLHPYMAPVDDDAGGGGGDADGPPEGSGISAAEWGALSPQERAAIAEPEDDTEALARIAQEEGDDDDDEAATKAAEAKAAKDAADKAAAEKVAADKADAEAKRLAESGTDAEKAAAKEAADKAAAAEAEKKAAADKAAANADADEGPGDFQVQLRPDKDPAKLQEEITKLETQTGELKAKFKAGDIEVDEYEEQRGAIDKQIRALDAEKIKAEFAIQHNEQSSEQRWFWQVETFYADPRNAIYENKLVHAAHDAAVKDLVSEQNLKDHPERLKWSGTRILLEADKEVRKSLNIGTAPAAQTAAEKDAAAATAKAAAEKDAADKKKAALKSRQPPEIPKSLAHLPAADANTDAGSDDEFSHIDKLTGMAQENAIAALTPAQAQRYLQSA